jgi:hypothetical protein
MARTTKSVSFKKIKNKSETNAHFRRNVPMKDRKKDQSKYGSRASRAPDHNQYSQDLEFELDDDLEYHSDIERCDQERQSILNNGDGLLFCNIHWCEHSFLHDINFIKGITDDQNSESQSCVWKEL